jgi:small ligand-binding sensory domain FIST
VSVRIGTGLSEHPDPRSAAVEAATLARAGLGGADADLVCCFFTGAHLGDPEGTLDGVHEALAPAALVGCGAAGVVGRGREVEGGDAVVVWAADLGEGSAETFHAELTQVEDGVRVEGFPALDGASGTILLPDPFSFPTDRVLAELAHAVPGVPILGGLASARGPQGTGTLLVDDRVVSGGAAGVVLRDLELLPCVSQGAAPVGPELTVTASEDNVILELAGRPALARLRQVLDDELTDVEREMLTGGLLLGLVIEGGKPEYLQGDFLVRGLIGVDPEVGSVAVGAPVRPGQVVRLHARDAASADRDLRDALELRRVALGGRPPAGSLVFTCNGRGRGMFGVADHDALALRDAFGSAPAAGFFAAGEIGPVGGEPFLHSFTATVAVFG